MIFGHFQISSVPEFRQTVQASLSNVSLVLLEYDPLSVA